MTRQVAANEQGRLQGAVSSLNSVAGIIGPLLFAGVFSQLTARHLHTAWVGLTFWMAGAMILVALLLAWRGTGREA